MTIFHWGDGSVWKEVLQMEDRIKPDYKKIENSFGKDKKQPNIETQDKQNIPKVVCT